MVKIFLQVFQCKASVKYGAILYGVNETYQSENIHTLTFIRKNKCRSILQHSLRRISMVAR